MAKTLYCWRCKKELPMLEEHEWERLSPLLSDTIQQIKNYREDHNATLEAAKSEGYGKDALELYSEMTGYRETNPNNLWHHRLNQFGPPCISCGKPLRTPKAKMCAECGASQTD